MLKISKEGRQGDTGLRPLGYAEARGLIGRYILFLTRWLRAENAEKYMSVKGRHLDIGCGDAYFLQRSSCKELWGLDALLGDKVQDKIDFPDSYLDYVTMLAVIEHLDFPEQIIPECFRILKKDGTLIITTPKAKSSWITKLYSRRRKRQECEHKRYFDYDSMCNLLKGFFVITTYKTFGLGFNQLFVCNKSGCFGD